MSDVHAPSDAAPQRRFPPVVELTTGSLGLVVVGGIYLASNLSERSLSLAPAVGLLIASAVLFVVAAASTLRIDGFAWPRFRLVAGWTLLAYVVEAGMLAYIFSFDHTPARVLTVLLLMLVLFMVDVPLIVAFTVARYADTTPAASAG